MQDVTAVGAALLVLLALAVLANVAGFALVHRERRRRLALPPPRSAGDAADGERGRDDGAGPGASGASGGEGAPPSASSWSSALGDGASLARRSSRSVSSVPRLPVVFVHGMLGFDAIQLAGVRREYFRGLRAMLAGLDVEAYFLAVAPVGGVALRARQLARHVRALPAPRVNVVAHSMGGIDARFAVARLGLADRVASITTVGTPHRGTPLADVGAATLHRLRLPFPALRDVTTARTRALNVRAADVDGVSYASVVGIITNARDVPPALAAGWMFLSRRAGDNDGLVPVSSQRWGDVLATIGADHWAQIGWGQARRGTRFDTLAFYRDLLRELRARGL